MERTLICLDVGHTPGSGGNPPAGAGHYREDRLNTRYAGWTKHFLDAGVLAAGVPVETAILSYGTYSARRHWALNNTCNLYLNLHGNSGSVGGYGLILGHHQQDENVRGPVSKAIATALGATFAQSAYRQRVYAGNAAVIQDVAGPEGYREKNPWPAGAWTLMHAIVAHAPHTPVLVLEPGDVGNTLHQVHLWSASGLRQLGQAIAVGIATWLGDEDFERAVTQAARPWTRLAAEDWAKLPQGAGLRTMDVGPHHASNQAIFVHFDKALGTDFQPSITVLRNGHLFPESTYSLDTWTLDTTHPLYESVLEALR